MSTKIHLRGHRVADDAADAATDAAGGVLASLGMHLRDHVRVEPDARGELNETALDADDDDVLELVYENGLVDLVSVAEARELGVASRRAGVDGVELPMDLGNAVSRGRVDRLITEVKRFACELPSAEDLVREKLLDTAIDVTADLLARALVRWLEREFWSNTEPPGLYHVTEDLALRDPLEPSATADAGTRPYLLLVHGTFSNTRDGFGQLRNTAEWSELRQRYDGRVLALEHKTVSLNPVENGLDLVRRLPVGATLHLVSHSRGGLVGDLLSLPEVGAGARERYAGLREDDAAAELDALDELTATRRDRNVRVERFVRVACPARGTILASRRLDRYLKVVLNVIRLIPAAAASPTYAFVKALAMALVGKKADPRVMPGVEAMMPESPLIGLLNSVREPVDDGLAVVAGDIQGEGIFGTLKVLATDLLYREDHDLVVHTASMYQGLGRRRAIASFQRGPEISHSSYFGNAVARARLRNWLVEERPDGFQPLPTGTERIRPDNVSRAAGAEAGDRPRVVFVPAQMTVELGRTWLDPAALADGGLRDLRTSRSRPGDLIGPYQELFDHLEPRYEVVPFAWDWRRSAETAAARLAERLETLLAEDRPGEVGRIAILAHSGGGLVPLSMMAVAPDTWARLREQGGRLVLLGTPLRGSWSVLDWLRGGGSLVRQLHLVDPRLSCAELGGMLAKMPGLLEMLPEADEPGADADPWRAKTLATLGCDPRPSQRSLTAARRVREKIAALDLTDGVAYVSGQADRTPAGLDEDGTLLAHADGDGFVPWTTGPPAGVPSWNVPVDHARLASCSQAFDAIVELLETGATTQLAPGPPFADDEPCLTPLAEEPTLYPTANSILTAALGGAEAEPATDLDHDITIRLEVLHGSLQFLRSPVAVGHYEGTPLDGAEGFLDRRLDGRLSESQMLDLYPGPAGTAQVFEAAAAAPPGAIVVGLGPIGELTPQGLSQSVTQAALAYANRIAGQRSDGDTGRRSAAFAAVLLGTSGRYGIPVRSSVSAIVRGVIEANLTLRNRGMADQVVIDAVQFVEQYADTAEMAARAVRDIESDVGGEITEGITLAPARLLREIAGGLPGQPDADYEEGSWTRVLIDGERQEQDHLRLEYQYLGRRALAEVAADVIDPGQIDPTIARVIRSRELTATNNTLFELLLPNELKSEIGNAGNLLFVVDGVSAEVPWEMLASRDRRGTLRPLALRSSLLRQLSGASDRAGVRSPAGNRALVIGNPPAGTGYPPLAGARAEAHAVATLLEGLRGADAYDVTALVGEPDDDGPSWLDINDALFEQPYRILHIAAHGMFRPDDPRRSGVVIGENQYLTGETIRKLPAIPDFVFLNCCYLAQITGRGRWKRELEQTHENLNRFAASVAGQLMARGVRAVVAAGWAVDDLAAHTFAVELYGRLFEGYAYGEAVYHAREAAREVAGHRSNTWLAYQCYGDPGFRLVSRRAWSATERPPVARHELTRRLDRIGRIATGLTDPSRDDRTREIRRQLQDLERNTPVQWHAAGGIGYAFGSAYAALGQFPEALRHFRAAAKAWEADAPLRLHERLANLQVRRAVDLARKTGPPPVEGESVETLLEDAWRRLELLGLLEPTPERHALHGSYWKKRAALHTGDVQDDEVERAGTAYGRAYELSGADYHGLNWVQMIALRGTPAPAQVELVKKIREGANRQGRESRSFWDRIAGADADLTLALATGGLAEAGDVLAGAYGRALRTGPRAIERESVLQHLDDLAHLTRSPADTRCLERLVAKLRDLAAPA